MSTLREIIQKVQAGPDYSLYDRVKSLPYDEFNHLVTEYLVDPNREEFSSGAGKLISQFVEEGRNAPKPQLQIRK